MAGRVSKKPDVTAVTVPYEPSAREKTAIQASRERRRARAPSPGLKVEPKGKGVKA